MSARHQAILLTRLTREERCGISIGASIRKLFYLPRPRELSVVWSMTAIASTSLR